MKKYLLLIVLLASVGNVAANEILSNSEVNAQWTGKEVIAYCRDFEHVNYFTVLNFGVVSYIVADEPEIDDEGNTIGYTPHIIGYGAKDESIHIMHAEVAEQLSLDPQWQPLEFTAETRF